MPLLYWRESPVLSIKIGESSQSFPPIFLSLQSYQSLYMVVYSWCKMGCFQKIIYDNTIINADLLSFYDKMPKMPRAGKKKRRAVFFFISRTEPELWRAQKPPGAGSPGPPEAAGKCPVFPPARTRRPPLRPGARPHPPSQWRCCGPCGR